MFTFGILVGALGASLAWWIEVRSLKGVISDLKDVRTETQKAVDNLK